MAKITLPDGTVIEGDSPDDAAATAAAFLKVKGAAAVVRIARERPTPFQVIIPRRHAPINGFDTESVTLALLESIKAAGRKGIPGAKVQEIVHADHPKGVGGRMVRVNGFLKTLGFSDPKAIFDNPRDPDGTSRIWKPKQEIDAAIEAVRKVMLK